MARMARLVIPGLPHHITQRGNRRERVFFGVLLINFCIGLGLTLWGGIAAADVRAARIGTGALWTLRAVLSLTTVGRAGKN